MGNWWSNRDDKNLPQYPHLMLDIEDAVSTASEKYGNHQITLNVPVFEFSKFRKLRKNNLTSSFYDYELLRNISE